MNMANIRKQMVLNLKVQSSDVPGKQRAVIGKISGRVKLMNSPAVIHFSIFIRHREFGAVNDVSWLKNDRQDKTGDVVHSHKPNEPLPPRDRHYHHWDHKYIPNVNNFCCN